MRYYHFLLILAAVVSAFNGRSGPAHGAPKAQKAFDPADDSVVCATDGIVVWRRSILDRATAMRESRTYISTYFVQRLGAQASLAYEAGPATSPTETAVLLKDNALLICAGTLLRWVRDGRVVREQMITLDSGTPSVLALYPDGLIATTTQPGKPDQLYWFPLGKDGLDPARSVRLESKLGPDQWLQFPRHHDEIAWIDSTNVPPAGGEKADRVSLYVFDVARGTVRSVKIHSSVGGGGHLDAFDGRKAIGGAELVDTTTGDVKRVSAMTNGLRGWRSATALALIDNNIYYVLDSLDAIEVRAVPLSQLGQSTIVYRITKSKLAAPAMERRLSARSLFFTDDRAIYAWNGASWESILAR